MDIQTLQEEVARALEGIEHPRLGAALALAEECGEVVRAVLEREIYEAPDQGALAAEVGDVLVSLAELCQRYEVSLAESANAALARLKARAPGWKETLGPRLAETRRRLDGDGIPG